MKHMVPPIMQNTIPLDQIIPHPRNFRYHPESQLKQLEASYERFGQFRSIVVQAQQTGPYLLVAGHGIAKAMRRKGTKEARCDVLPSNMPETDVDAIMIADNLLPLLAEDDEVLLARLLQEQQEAGYDLAGLGSSEDALIDLLAKHHLPSLDDLTDKYGDEVDDEAFWPVIRVKVAPGTRDRYNELMEQAEGEREAEKFAWILDQVETNEQ